ncbi:transposable element Tcb1 transposase [Trichonephila clavipes]|nr:transposable element Tcb1 transposase [Trichonephila clavipes]
MVRGVIAYNTRSSLILIRGTMTAQRYVHDILQPHVWPLMQRLTGAVLQHVKGVTRLSPYGFYPSLAYPIPRFVSNRAYLGSFGVASWASHEFERIRCKVTVNMGRNVPRHHAELVFQNV